MVSPLDQKGLNMFTYRLRGRVTAALVVLSAGIGAVLPATAAAQRRGHHVTHHRTRRPVEHGIPQNGGGDHDADNFGGPSDGDGNV
jgi:hypothetical protein